MSPRRETRQTCTDWDQELVLDIAAFWAAARLDDGNGILIIDETRDAKSSADAAGAARQYSGSTGGVALCQFIVTLPYAAGLGHTLLGRALYLPDVRAADVEHRELTCIPDKVMFTTKPQLVCGLLEHAYELGTEAAMVTGDEVYGGLDLHQRIRGLGLGYILAVRSNHALTFGSGKAVTAATAATVTPPGPGSGPAPCPYPHDQHKQTQRHEGEPPLRNQAGAHPGTPRTPHPKPNRTRT